MNDETQQLSGTHLTFELICILLTRKLKSTCRFYGLKFACFSWTGENRKCGHVIRSPHYSIRSHHSHFEQDNLFSIECIDSTLIVGD